MLKLKITVELDGKEIAEIESEISFEIIKKENEEGVLQTYAVVMHPSDVDLLPTRALNHAEDYLNMNPELWANGEGEDETPEI